MFGLQTNQVMIEEYTKQQRAPFKRDASPILPRLQQDMYSMYGNQELYGNLADQISYYLNDPQILEKKIKPDLKSQQWNIA